jgi:putative flippase GtrA
MRSDIKQTLGAGLGGVLGTAIDVAVLAALVQRGAGVAPSAFAGALAGAGVSFVMSKYVAFRDRSPLGLRQVAVFGLVAVVTALMMAVAMQLTAVAMGVPYLLAKAVCAAAVFVLWSYPAQRHLVFRPSHRSPSPA